jgi:hypothetical protein
MTITRELLSATASYDDATGTITLGATFNDGYATSGCRSPRPANH